MVASPPPLIDDLLADNLAVVFCGTALGTASYHAHAYYAHPQNRFYSILYSIGLIPQRINPISYRSLLDYGIGLTDLNKTQFGPDHALSPCHFSPQALRTKIFRFKPQRLAFTSKTAAKHFFSVRFIDYGEHAMRLGTTRIFVLPSTSGRAVAWWDPQWWYQLARDCHGCP